MRILNTCLCAVGSFAYVVILGWTTIGVWPLCFNTLSKIWLTVSTGLPVPIQSEALTLPLVGLAVYYSLASPLITRIFSKLFVLRPVLVVGFTFFTGLTATHILLTNLINSGFANRAGIAAISIGGIGLTRAAMSWLFWKFPVELFNADR